MSVQWGPKTPTGYGKAEFRLEGGAVDVPVLRYFNRGLQARGSGRLTNIWGGPDQAKLDGYVIGTLRPLKDLKLPFAADVDKILSVVQQSVTTVRVEGTLHHPKPRSAAFSEAGETLRRILVGDVRQEKSGRGGGSDDGM